MKTKLLLLSIFCFSIQAFSLNVKIASTNLEYHLDTFETIHSLHNDPDCVEEDTSCEEDSVINNPNDVNTAVFVAPRVNINNANIISGGIWGISDVPTSQPIGASNNTTVVEYMRAGTVNVDASSTVGQVVEQPTSFVFPPFIANNQSTGASPDMNISSGNTVIENGTVFDQYSISNGTTVRFTGSELYFNTLAATGGGTYEFDQDVTIYITNFLSIRTGSSFNTENVEAIVYVGDGSLLREGANVTAFIQQEAGSTSVGDNASGLRTTFNGRILSPQINCENADVAIEGDVGSPDLFEPEDVVVTSRRLLLRDNTVIHSGGLVKNSLPGNQPLFVRDGSMVAEFVQANNVLFDADTSIGTIYEQENVSFNLPEFKENNLSVPQSPDLIVDSGGTVVIDEFIFNDITISNGSTVTFTSPQIYARDLLINTGATVEFDVCSEIYLSRRFGLRGESNFNIQNQAVSLYVATGSQMDMGPDFTGFLYQQTGSTRIYGNPDGRRGTFKGKLYSDLVTIESTDVYLQQIEECTITSLDPNNQENVIITGRRMEFNFNSVIHSGGVVKNSLPGNQPLFIKNNSIIVDYAKANEVVIGSTASVGTVIEDPATSFILPEFKENNLSVTESPDLIIDSGQTVVVDDFIFNDILITNGSTVTFTSPQIYARDLQVNFGSTVEFDVCTEVYVSRRFGLRGESNFNTNEQNLTLFVETGSQMDMGPDFTGQLYQKTGTTRIYGNPEGRRATFKGKLYTDLLRVINSDFYLRQFDNCDITPLDPADDDNVVITSRRMTITKNSIIQSGGLVKNSLPGNQPLFVQDNSIVVDYAKANNVYTSINGSVGTIIEDPATSFDLPVFKENNLSVPQSPDLIIDSGETVVVDDFIFNDILITNGSTVTFTSPQIYARDFQVNTGSTVEFELCSEIYVNRRFGLRDESNFNTNAQNVSLFVATGSQMDMGPDFTGFLYQKTGITRLYGNPEGRRATFKGKLYTDFVRVEMADVFLQQFDDCEFEPLDPADQDGQVIVASRVELKLYSTVFSGGVVKNNFLANETLEVSANSTVVDYVRGNPVIVSGNSGAGQIIDEVVDEALPEFKLNTFTTTSSPNLIVDSGEEIIISDNVFENILITNGSTVRFTSPQIYARDLKIEDGSNVEFDVCTEIYLTRRFGMNEGTSFNTEATSVTLYVVNGAQLFRGPDFTGVLYIRDGDIRLSGVDRDTKAQFKGRMISSTVFIKYADISLMNFAVCEIESEPVDPNAIPFNSVWNITNAGDNAGFKINSSENVFVDWGDGTNEVYVGITDISHVYATPGNYTVGIRANGAIEFEAGIDAATKARITDVTLWGNNELTSMRDAFKDCINLNVTALDAPDLSNVTIMFQTFRGATQFNGNIASWDVSNVEIMAYAFGQAINFNQDISSWDTENVTNTGAMFLDASAFNQDISGWDMSSNTDMRAMFGNATAFNQDLGAWNIEALGAVNNMQDMLSNSGLSVENYDATLLGWSTLDAGETAIPNDILLGVQGLIYCDIDGRDTLEVVNNWIFDGDSQDPACQDRAYNNAFNNRSQNVYSALEMYPNPTVNTVTVTNLDKATIEHVIIYDVTGRVVLDVTMDATTTATLDVSTLQQATYMMVISGEKGSVTKQLVKE